MSGPSDATPTGLRAIRTQRIPFVLAGTAVLLLVAGVLFQVLRAQPTHADARQTESSSQAGGQTQSGSPMSKPAAWVDKEPVTYGQLAQECIERHGKEVLENIISRTIIQQACRKRGISIKPTEVDREVQRIAGRFNVTVADWYKLLQEERDITPAQYQRDVIWPMLALRRLAGSEMSISDKEIQTAFVRDYQERVKAKLIMLDSLDEAQRIWKLASENPQEFGRLARTHSIDPNSRALDGQIPPIRKYVGHEELWNAAFKLEEGEVSGIIEVGPRQYVILLCEGFTKPLVKDLEQVRADLTERLREEKEQMAVADVFQKLRDEATITNYLTREQKTGIRQTSHETSGSPQSRTGAGTATVRQQPSGGSPSTSRAATRPGAADPGGQRR